VSVEQVDPQLHESLQARVHTLRLPEKRRR
jgi:hypothetical protein